MNKRTVEIHEDFRKALDTNVLVIEEPQVSKNIEVYEGLRSLGFTGSKTFTQESIKDSIIREVRSKNELIEALKAIEAKYPDYRIISLSKVVKLMKKYNLCFGPAHNYTEIIPQKNIQELKKYDSERIKTGTGGFLDSVERRSKYQVVAPRAFFKKDLVSVNGFLLEKQKANFEFKFPELKFETDPIVLHRLHIPEAGNEIFFHVVTAWDIEANDEDVTNDIGIVSTSN